LGGKQISKQTHNDITIALQFQSQQSEKNLREIEGRMSARTETGNHSQLLNKLEEFMSKQKYFNDYMTACKMIAAQEVMKPQAERASIPSMEINDNPEVSAIHNKENNKEPANPNTDPEVQVMEKRAASSSRNDSSKIRQKKRQRLLEENCVAGEQTQRTPKRKTDASSVGLGSSSSVVVPQVSPEQGGGKMHSTAKTAGSETTQPLLAAAVATKKLPIQPSMQR